MKNSVRLLIIIASGFFIYSCASEFRSEKRIDVYYDVQSLLNEQLVLLANLQPKIKKTIVIDGNKETEEVIFDKDAWNNELEIFNLADINKPVLKDQYEAFEKITKEGKIIRYAALNDRPGITSLVLTFDNGDIIKKLLAEYKEKNYLYSSVRKLELNFDILNSVPILTEYKVSGNQKMIMKNQVDFLITSNIELPN